MIDVIKRRYFGVSIFMLLALAFIASSSYGQEIGIGNAKTLTISDAIKIAIRNNKAIQMQEQQVMFAKAGILYGRSLFLPQVGAGYSYTLNDAVPFPLEFPGQKQRKDPSIFTGYKNDNLFTLTADESFYNGGANIATLKQAKIDMKIQKETLRAGTLTVEFDTKRLFYGILLAYETRRIAQDLVNQAQAHYETVKAKYDQGTSSKFDLLQSKVQISTVMPQLVNAENDIELLMAEFKKLLSIQMKDLIKIDGKLDYTLIDIREDEFLQVAYRDRPEMILKSLGVDMNKWGIEFAKAGWLPQVSGNASYSFRSDNISEIINPRHDNWSVGLKVSMALFDGFSTKAKVDEAKAMYNQAILQKEDVSDQTAVDIRRACLNLKHAKAIIDSQKDSVEEAREALRLADERYKAGVGINLDVLDAEVSLAQVEQNLAQGVYDYIMANAQLDKTMGKEFLKEAVYAKR